MLATKKVDRSVLMGRRIGRQPQSQNPLPIERCFDLQHQLQLAAGGVAVAGHARHQQCHDQVRCVGTRRRCLYRQRFSERAGMAAVADCGGGGDDLPGAQHAL